MSLSEINVHLCGYSKHLEPFKHDYRNGLDTYIIRLQLEGFSQALIEGEIVDILPGDLLLFKPGDAYALNIGEPGEPMKPNGDYFIMSTGPRMDEWWAQKRRPTRTKLAEDERIKGQWQQLIQEKRRLDGGYPELITLLVRTLLLLLDRAIEEAPPAQSVSAFHALKMRNFIEENASSVLRLQDIASHAGLSVSRAVHLFKDRFGVSAMQYAQQLRLSHALELLDHSLLSLEQIAMETGLGSYTYFHRVFRATYGISPGAYRKRQSMKVSRQ
ncbi:DNA-binding transcriptional regulator AraC [Paenibacillus baekrokdamisoli]|uniref:DNA-binding transcriptional regulator AraC n=1 Tax=Paenibacillus baekrokdamisoli TaxID=1712516 RepID=A0A3G9JAH6_9BACL|nr:AraC family transcriptional regulator [Paenibacillus baekrokdamisoli]BBH21883.1 DNA-binding transcriptional regulator AraC [Paenibacillus baekrokdamisoli]